MGLKKKFLGLFPGSNKDKEDKKKNVGSISPPSSDSGKKSFFKKCFLLTHWNYRNIL